MREFLEDDNTLRVMTYRMDVKLVYLTVLLLGIENLTRMIVDFVTILLVNHLYNIFQIHLTLMD